MIFFLMEVFVNVCCPCGVVVVVVLPLLLLLLLLLAFLLREGRRSSGSTSEEAEEEVGVATWRMLPCMISAGAAGKRSLALALDPDVSVCGEAVRRSDADSLAESRNVKSELSDDIGPVESNCEPYG